MFSLCAVQEIQEASLKYTLEIIVALVSILIGFGMVIRYINSKVSKKTYCEDENKRDKKLEKLEFDMKEYVDIQVKSVSSINEKISTDIAYIRKRLDEHIDNAPKKR